MTGGDFARVVDDNGKRKKEKETKTKQLVIGKIILPNFWISTTKTHLFYLK